MIHIDLTKYGFERYPEADIIDDTNTVKAYRVNGMVVTKTIHKGLAYIICEPVLGDTLMYSEYSQLPHFKSLNELNGVLVSEITEADLERFFENCLQYISEWMTLETVIDFPSFETIWCIVNQQHHAASCRAAELKRLCTLEAIIKLSDDELKTFKEAATIVLNEACFDVYERTTSLVNTCGSRELVRRSDAELVKPSFAYERCMQLLCGD